MNLINHTVLITGGGSGIGLAIARQLYARGNQLLLVGRTQATLDAALSELPGATAYVADVTSPDEVARLVRRVQADFPALSVLVNNAGYGHPYRLGAEAGAHDKALAELQLNFLAAVRLTELLLPTLARQPAAAVVNVSSVVALVPSITLPTYSASKAALHAYSQALRYTLAASPVRVFEVMPPLVNTGLTKDIGGEQGIPPGQVADELLAGMARDEYEIHVGQTAQLYELLRTSPAQALAALNAGR